MTKRYHLFLPPWRPSFAFFCPCAYQSVLAHSPLCPVVFWLDIRTYFSYIFPTKTSFYDLKESAQQIRKWIRLVHRLKRDAVSKWMTFNPKDVTLLPVKNSTSSSYSGSGWGRIRSCTQSSSTRPGLNRCGSLATTGYTHAPKDAIFGTRMAVATWTASLASASPTSATTTPSSVGHLWRL
jgi:hypothetical protein